MPNSSPIYLEVEDIFAISAEQQQRRKSTSGKEQTNYTNRAIMSFLESVSKMNEAVLVPSKLRDIEVRESEVNGLMPVNSDLYSFYQMLNNVKQDLFSNTKYQNAFMLANSSTTNSGQNSGRVTPTQGLSRRSSAIGMYGSSPSTATTPTTPNGSRTLMPPTSLLFERKLSSSSSLNGDLSPELVLNGNGNYNSNGNSSLLSPTSISPVPMSFSSRADSLNSLLAAVGLDDVAEGGGTNSEERVQQLTALFTHHLTALNTILGHFTRGAAYITRRYQEETENI